MATILRKAEYMWFGFVVIFVIGNPYLLEQIAYFFVAPYYAYNGVRHYFWAIFMLLVLGVSTATFRRFKQNIN